MAVITLLFFLSISIFLSHLVIERKNVFFVFRAIGLISVILVVSSFYMGFLRIPINPFSFSVLITAICCAIILIRKEKTKRSLAEVIKAKTVFDKKRILLCIIIIAISLLSSWDYFGTDFKAPQFVGVDPAVHFMMGKYVSSHDQLLFFNRDILFHNIDTYPFGSSIILASFQKLLPFVSATSIFTIVNILFYILIGCYFILVTLKYHKIRSRMLLFLYVILMQLGFFFTLLIMGFWSQAVGLFLLIFFVDIYSPKKFSFSYLLLYAGTIVAILFTYIYWLPIAMLFLAFRHMSKKYLTRYFLTRLFLVLFMSAILASPYMVSLIRFHLLSYASSDGGTYKVFALNFIPLAIFIIYGIFFLLQDWKKKPKNFSSFFIASMIYFIILYIAYANNLASAYTFAKIFYLFGPIIYFLSILSLDTLFEKIEKPANSILISATSLIVMTVILYPFANKSHPPLGNISFEPNFWSLEGQVFDIYYSNAKMIRYDARYSAHRRLAGDNFWFIADVPSHIPPEYRANRTMVIADSEMSLWFYALTDIWPRTLVDNNDSVSSLAPYDRWKIQRLSPILILLDTQVTRQWKKENGFNIADYDILYREKNNYLLRLKN